MFDTLTRMGASAAGAYEIKKSLRFNRPDDTYLSRTPSSAGNRRTFTLSCWVKAFGDGRFIEAGSASGTNGSGFMWIDRKPGFIYDVGATWFTVRTAGQFRDTSSWYHVVWQIDTTQADGANRVKIFVNGVSQSMTYTASSGTHIPQNTDLHINNTIVNSFGRRTYDTAEILQANVAEVHFLDGTITAPTAWGETDTTTGQWIPKEYEGGNYGTNGFYLDFFDNSDTTATTLGKDSSGQGNNWTPSNFSVAAGEGNDSSEDTPTNNCCTLNPLKGYDTTFVTPTNGNLDASLGSTNYMAFSSIAIPPSGKWYAECKFTDVETGRAGIKLATDTSKWNGVWYLQQGEIRVDTSVEQSSLATISDNDIVGIAVDRDANTIQFYKNGSTVGSTESISATGDYHFGQQRNGSSGGNPQGSWNFGQRAFGNLPSGFQALTTNNLPTPTIKNGTDYFNSVLYTSNATAGKTVTGVGFSPNLFWAARRNGSGASSQMYDTVRGVGKALDVAYGNATEVQNGVTNFGSDGVTLGATWPNANNGDSWVAWNWKESATAGFDIVSYSGTGSAQTVSHSLGVAPEMMIIKNLDSAYHWAVYHHKLTDAAENHLTLSELDGAAGGNTWWNDTAPTSSVFTVLSANETNKSGDDYIAYLFSSVAGYSKVGSYTGNNNSNGVFIYTGFKPAYLMLKKRDANGSWKIFDNKRDTYNLVRKQLAADSNGAEEAYDNLDFVSNGIKMRNSFSDTNASAAYVYIAFAEAPFKYANAR